MRALREHGLLAAVFVIAGLQLLGFVLQNRAIRGLGTATAASPLPFVFSSHDGIETFTPRFAVELVDERTQRIEIGPELYSRLGGAYNRRNVYGVIFSHGPLLIRTTEGRALLDAVARYGLCAGGTLQREFGLSSEARTVTLEARPRDPAAPTWRHEVACP